MRQYIYKVIIAVIALILVFEFTIGKTLNKITSQTDVFLTKEGRKDLVKSLKKEIDKANNKENYFDEEEKLLLKRFINKIAKELEINN
tara:strand:+ start:381 stop:644 length:264 start_codon:yes stop_codon:yes gene_type:complete